MPTPRPGDETQSEWMNRCVPELIDEEGREQDQAVAICMDMWREATKAASTSGHERLSFPLELKALHEREIEGLGAVFGNVDFGGDIVLPGAFKRSLAEHKRNGTSPQMFWMHDPTRVPGKWTEIAEHKRGLHVKGVLAETDLGDEMRVLAQMQAVRGLSIGYSTKDADFDKDGNRLLKEVELWEVSLVSLAMNPLARISQAKSRLSEQGEYVPTEREFERILRRAGCSKSVARTLIPRIFDDGSGGMPDAPSARWDAGSVEADPEAEEVLKALALQTDQFWTDVFKR